VRQPSGIATDGTSLWILDAARGAVDYFAGAAGRTSGSQAATSSFALAAGDANPTGLTTDGSTIWVVDASGQVFVYAASGAALSAWGLDAGQTSPSGITLDPAGGTDLWVVDRGTGQVYQYAGAQAWRSGSYAASATFRLAAADADPTGIADPLSGDGRTYSPLGDGLTAANMFLGGVTLPSNPFGPQLSALLYSGVGNPQAMSATDQTVGAAGDLGYGSWASNSSVMGYRFYADYGLAQIGPGIISGFGSYALPAQHGGSRNLAPSPRRATMAP
jgi:hypothetical protein